jgi:hypothetical protein
MGSHDRWVEGSVATQPDPYTPAVVSPSPGRAEVTPYQAPGTTNIVSGERERPVAPPHSSDTARHYALVRRAAESQGVSPGYPPSVAITWSGTPLGDAGDLTHSTDWESSPGLWGLAQDEAWRVGVPSA